MPQIDLTALEDLYEVIRKDSNFKHFRASTDSRLVPGEGGNPTAFIIGEAPGATEALTGRPFVGAAGIVLRQLMEIANLHSWFKEGSQYQPNCWLTNVLKYRPPRNRTPTIKEIKYSRPYLRAEWYAVGCPALIIPVGGAALHAVMGQQISILKFAGKPFTRPSKHRIGSVKVWPMLHPSYGLRNPELRPLMEQHWNELGEWRARHQG